MFMNTQMESIILPQNSSVLSAWSNPDALKELAETVPPSLRLVCSSWSSALKNSTFSVGVLNMLSQFVYNKLLIWVEIMSLIGKYDEIEPALMHVTNWISVSFSFLFLFLRNQSYIVETKLLAG